MVIESRDGPEPSETGRGTYQPEQIPLTVADLGAIDLKPTAIAALLGDAIAAGRDLFKLPDCVHYQLHHVSRVVHELLVRDGRRPASRRMVVD
ncbi:MAG: hypothetical protein JO242_07795 [Streptosporangiaceae bacterium]|nr:hypothetical protein [Streptosporangiaceae bacterium]